MKSDTVQTIVRLPRPLLTALKKRAADDGTSLAQIIRELGEGYVMSAPAPRTLRRQKQKDFMTELVELAERNKWRGPRDLSVRLDDYLYGDA